MLLKEDHPLRSLIDNSLTARVRAQIRAEGYAEGYRAGRVDCANEQELDAYDRGRMDGWLAAIAEQEGDGGYSEAIAASS